MDRKQQYEYLVDRHGRQHIERVIRDEGEDGFNRLWEELRELALEDFSQSQS